MLKKYLIFICLSIIFQFANSQSKKNDLLKDKKKIEEEIKYTNKLLIETQKNKKASINQINILKNKISQREKLIDNINNHLNVLEQEIESNGDDLEKLNIKLINYKEEYANLIFAAWRNYKSFNTIMFILSSNDFEQGYRRLKYLNEYSKYRRKQAELIIATQNKISGKIELLKVNKIQKETLLTSKEKEKNRLNNEKEETSNNIKILKQKETQLRKTLKEKEKANRQLNNSIQGLISEEIKKAKNRKISKNNKKEVETKKNKIVSNKEDNTISLTPEEQTLSNNFGGNKGKLPWPVERGVISSNFGEHPHPVISGVTVKNNGIDISTQSGQNARTIFSGVVSGIVSLPNDAKAIIVRHGDYLTVYSNLININVSKNQKVSAKQNIGTIKTDTEENKTELHFEIWHNKNIQNPNSWIKK